VIISGFSKKSKILAGVRETTILRVFRTIGNFGQSRGKKRSLVKERRSLGAQLYSLLRAGKFWTNSEKAASLDFSLVYRKTPSKHDNTKQRVNYAKILSKRRRRKSPKFSKFRFTNVVYDRHMNLMEVFQLRKKNNANKQTWLYPKPDEALRTVSKLSASEETPTIKSIDEIGLGSINRIHDTFPKEWIVRPYAVFQNSDQELTRFGGLMVIFCPPISKFSSQTCQYNTEKWHTQQEHLSTKVAERLDSDEWWVIRKFNVIFFKNTSWLVREHS